MADEKLREHWVSNCPELRELESRQMERRTHEEWEHQKERKKQVSTKVLHVTTPSRGGET